MSKGQREKATPSTRQKTGSESKEESGMKGYPRTTFPKRMLGECEVTKGAKDF